MRNFYLTWELASQKAGSGPGSAAGEGPQASEPHIEGMAFQFLGSIRSEKRFQPLALVQFRRSSPGRRNSPQGAGVIPTCRPDNADTKDTARLSNSAASTRKPILGTTKIASPHKYRRQDRRKV